MRGDLVTFALIGRLQSDNLEELKKLLEMRNGKKIGLDLREVKIMIERQSRFLGTLKNMTERSRIVHHIFVNRYSQERASQQ